MKKIKILIMLVFILMLLLQAGCSEESNLLMAEDNIKKETFQNQESIYLEDALNLIIILEGTHPAFALEDIGDNYNE